MLYNHGVYGWTEKNKITSAWALTNMVFMVVIEGELMGLLA